MLMILKISVSHISTMDVFGSSADEERVQTISSIEKSNRKIKSDLSALGQTLDTLGNKIKTLENNINTHIQQFAKVENKIIVLENNIQKLTKN